MRKNGVKMLGFAKQVLNYVMNDVEFWNEYVCTTGHKSEKEFKDLIVDSVEVVMSARSVGNSEYEGNVYDVIMREFEAHTNAVYCASLGF